MSVLEYTADGSRLDVLLSQDGALSRSRAAELIKSGAVTVDDRAEGKPSAKPAPGALVRVEVPEPRPAQAEAQDIPLKILYQDAHLAVVVKPCGMVVHPAAGNENGTLVNALLYAMDDLSGVGGVKRPGIVHRLDKDTSGLMLVAKNDASHLDLSRQLHDHAMEKHYLAVVEGCMKEPGGFIDLPIGRSRRDRKKMAVDPSGRPAQTEWRLLENLKGAALLDVHILTGRTHQIRVHMQSLHHSLAGDPIYGLKNGVKVPRLMLHAWQLSFTHPRTGQRLRFCAPPPPEYLSALQKLRLDSRLPLNL